jgi:hypothetical protein
MLAFKRLGEKIRWNNVELWVFIVFFLLNLRVLNWFESPYIVMGGDLRLPIGPAAFLQHAFNTWTEIDWGIPSVYPPRLLDPLLCLMTVFQTVGVSAFASELMTTYLIYVLVSILAYMYVKRLTDGDIVAAFVAALFFTSNIALVVDREQTAISFMDMSLMILPCLVAFAEGLRRESPRIIAISGFLFVLTYAAFPNYRASVLCSIALFATLLFTYIKRGLLVDYRWNGNVRFPNFSLNPDLIRKYGGYIVVFIIAVLLASIWVIMLVYANFASLFAAYQQATPSIPFWLYINAHDALRLIAKWSFYVSAMGHPYTPYAALYLNNPVMIVLSYVPPIFAFAALLVSKSRKLAVFFGLVAILFLALTVGFTSSFSTLYSDMSNSLPLMRAFRESTNWIFLVILAYGVLIGLFLSASCRRLGNRALKILVLVLAISLLLYTSFPLITGDVTRNWLNPNIKGAYLPPYLGEAENAIPNNYWTILLPQRGLYVTYNFTNGGVLSCGNPYPLIFSKPVLSGSGTEYVQSENLDLLNAVYELMLTSPYRNVAPKGNALASSVEREGEAPAQAIDGNYGTRWASNHSMPQWFEIDWNKTQELSEIRIVFESAYANDYTIETWNGSSWTTQITVENNTLLEPEYIFPQLTATTKLRINFTKALPFNMVSIWELEAYTQADAVPKFLGMLGVRDLLVENEIVGGNLSNVKDLRILNESAEFTLIDEWNGASLYENAYALEKFYPASNILLFSNVSDLYQLIEGTGWSTLQYSAFLNSTSTSNLESLGALQTPESFAWDEVSPTGYTVNVDSREPFLLVFLESYDSHWIAFVNGKLIPQSNHVEVNDFANGWLVNATGNLTITVEYETQNLMTASVAVSIALPALFLVFLVRKKIKHALLTLKASPKHGITRVINFQAT